MATPVFVVGKHRSGTTWLANQLCEHSQVAGVRHSRHHGIHESAYFSCVAGRYGELSAWPNFVEFVEVISRSDYFRLAGATRAELYALWPTGYAAVFRHVMDRLAERAGAAYWLEKSPSHSTLVPQLARLYPDARFVAVRRGLEAVALSTLALDARRDPARLADRRARHRLIVQTALGWAYYNRVLEGFAAAGGNLLWVEYEAARADAEGTMRRLCDFLGLGFEAALLQPRYAPNTSFPRGSTAAPTLHPSERWAMRLAVGSARRAPAGWLARLAEARQPRRTRRSLPKWFFSLLDTGAPAGAGPPAASPHEASPAHHG